MSHFLEISLIDNTRTEIRWFLGTKHVYLPFPIEGFLWHLFRHQ